MSQSDVGIFVKARQLFSCLACGSATSAEAQRFGAHGQNLAVKGTGYGRPAAVAANGASVSAAVMSQLAGGGLRHNPIDVSLTMPEPVTVLQGNPIQRTYVATWCGMPVHLHVLTFVKRPNPIAQLPGPKAPQATVVAALDAPPPVQANMLTQPDMIAVATEVESALVQLIAEPSPQVVPVLACAKVTCRAHLGSPGDEHVTQRIVAEVHIVTPLVPGLMSLAQWVQERWPQCDSGPDQGPDTGPGAGAGQAAAGPGPAAALPAGGGAVAAGSVTGPGARTGTGASPGQQSGLRQGATAQAGSSLLGANSAAGAAAASGGGGGGGGGGSPQGGAVPPRIPPSQLQSQVALGASQPIAEGNLSTVRMSHGSGAGSSIGHDGPVGRSSGLMGCLGFACFEPSASAPVAAPVAASGPAGDPAAAAAAAAAAMGNTAAAGAAVEAGVAGAVPAAAPVSAIPRRLMGGPMGSLSVRAPRFPPPPPPPPRPRLSAPDALEVLIYLAEALRNLHRRGLTHGALTPKTIQLQITMPSEQDPAAGGAVAARRAAAGGEARSQPHSLSQSRSQSQSLQLQRQPSPTMPDGEATQAERGGEKEADEGPESQPRPQPQLQPQSRQASTSSSPAAAVGAAEGVSGRPELQLESPPQQEEQQGQQATDGVEEERREDAGPEAEAGEGPGVDGAVELDGNGPATAAPVAAAAVQAAGDLGVGAEAGVVAEAGVAAGANADADAGVVAEAGVVTGADSDAGADQPLVVVAETGDGSGSSKGSRRSSSGGGHRQQQAESGASSGGAVDGAAVEAQVQGGPETEGRTEREGQAELEAEAEPEMEAEARVEGADAAAAAAPAVVDATAAVTALAPELVLGTAGDDLNRELLAEELMVTFSHHVRRSTPANSVQPALGATTTTAAATTAAVVDSRTVKSAPAPATAAAAPAAAAVAGSEGPSATAPPTTTVAPSASPTLQPPVPTAPAPSPERQVSLPATNRRRQLHQQQQLLLQQHQRLGVRPLLPLPTVGPAVLQMLTWGRARPVGLPRDYMLWCAPELLSTNGTGFGAPLLARRSANGSATAVGIGGGSIGTSGLGPLDQSLGCRGAGRLRAGHSYRHFGDGSYGGGGGSIGGNRRVRANAAMLMGPDPTAAQGASNGVTPSCDVYSLGLLMWYLVSGQLPLQHLSTPEQVLRVKELGALDEQLPFCQDLPMSYIQLARRCWSPLPMQRPSIHAVLAEMRSLRAEMLGLPPTREHHHSMDYFGYGHGSSMGEMTADSRLSFTLSLALSSRELNDDYALMRPPLELAFGVPGQDGASGGGGSAAAYGSGTARGMVASIGPPPPPPPLTAALPPGLLTALTAPRQAVVSRRASGSALGGGGGNLMDDDDYTDTDRFTDIPETENSAGTLPSSPQTIGTYGRTHGGTYGASGSLAAAVALRSFRMLRTGGSSRRAGSTAGSITRSMSNNNNNRNAMAAPWGSAGGGLLGGGGGGADSGPVASSLGPHHAVLLADGSVSGRLQATNTTATTTASGGGAGGRRGAGAHSGNVERLGLIKSGLGQAQTSAYAASSSGGGTTGGGGGGGGGGGSGRVAGLVAAASGCLASPCANGSSAGS